MDTSVNGQLGQLDALIKRAQSASPLDRVTVLVATRAGGVHLRRGLGTARGLCNVVFRTLDDLVSELGRSALTPGLRAANASVLREALRQVLLAETSGRGAMAHSPRAVAELAGVLRELWLADPTAVARLRQLPRDGAGLVELLDAVDRHLETHGFAGPGSLVDAAMRAEDPTGALGTLVLWRLPLLAGRHRVLLGALDRRGVVVRDAPGADAVPTATRVIACSDPDEEVRAVLRLLLAAADEGVPLWKMAVVHPAGDRYRRIIHQQLALAEVPVSGSAPSSLSESATGRAAAGLLALAGSAWRRDEVIRWLESAPVTTGPRGVRAPVDRWDDVSARAGVVEGLDQWVGRLERFAASGAGRRDHVARNASDVEAARRLSEFVVTLAAEANPGDRRRWVDFAAWTHRLLDVYLLPADGAALWPPSELLAARDVRRLLEELGTLDAVSAGTDLSWFRHTLAGELRTRRLRRDSEAEADVDGPDDVRVLPGATGNGVFVGSFADARGLDFDRCFAVGLADGLAPSYLDEGLLPDLGPDAPAGWPTTLAHQEAQRSDFCQALASAPEQAVVTWPRVDPRTGRELTRSRWLAEFAASEAVASFEAGLRGVLADGMAASGADRRLALLADAARRALDPREHPLVRQAADDPDAGVGVALSEALAAAAARSEPAFSRFDGNVGVIGTEQAGIDRELSPTRLEQYAHCPRKFLLDRQLRVLAPFRPEATEQMEARDRGTLIHAILETYVRERIEQGVPASLDRLLEIGADQFAQAEAEGRCGTPLMAHVERLTLRRELGRFFEEDVLQPVAVELRFGGAAATHDVPDDRLGVDEADDRRGSEYAALEVALADGRPVRFVGSIDRVDRDHDGTIVVSDYKTGAQRDLADLGGDPVAGGQKLQLAVYAMAARAYLADAGKVVARYWLTSWRRSSPSYACALTPALEARAIDAMSLIVSGIESGAFPGTPGEIETRPGGTFANCHYCDFDRLCPADRDRRWSTVRESPAVTAIVSLQENDPPAELRGMVRAEPLVTDGGTS
jgi:RecB family exonuclease